MEENHIDAAFADVFSTLDAQYHMTLVELRMTDAPLTRVAYFRQAAEHLMTDAYESGDEKVILMTRAFERYIQLQLLEDFATELATRTE